MLDKKQITVGELAKQANVTIRTLQYYDKIGLLKPSAFTEGGRRLYHSDDISVLHQIITLKSLGLSLKDIEKKLIPINSTDDVVTMLNQQSELIKEQISKASKVLESINMIKKEINVTKKVDWANYADMVKLINDNNEYYWVLNFLEKDILASITEVHETHSQDEMPIEWLKESLEKVIKLSEKGMSPESEEAMAIAHEWWKFVSKYTKGDMKLMDQLYKFYNSADRWPAEFGEIQKQSREFMEKAIGHYFMKNNISMVPKELNLDSN